jgi:CheY-like chemotaxis protein
MKQIKKLCITVVEDNLFYQQLIAKQLESISSAIHFFSNGEECLEQLLHCKADLIVLDNNLGGMMTGLETLKLIRVIEPDLHVILFSTELGLDTEENASSFGVFEYVEKNNTGFKKLKDRIVKSDVYQRETNLKV